MRSKLGVFAISAALAASAAAVLAGEEPKRLDLKAPDLWEAGEVFTVTETASQETDVTASKDDGESAAKRQERRRESVVVWRCLEADAEGRPLRALAFVKTWKQTRRGRADASLTGALFEVTPERTTSRLPEGKWSDDAKKWIQKNVRLRSEADKGPFGDLEIPQSLEVGETCKIPLASAAAVIGGGEGPPPAIFGKVETSFRLDAADETPGGTSVRGTMEFQGPLAGEIQSSPEAPKVVVGEGSTIRCSGKSSALLGRSHRQRTRSVEGEMTLVTEVMGVSTRAVSKFRSDRRHEPGGEMPEPPPPPPAPAKPGTPLPPHDPKEAEPPAPAPPK